MQKNHLGTDDLFVRNCWYVAAWTHELAAGQLFPQTIINEPLVLYRRDDGQVACMEDRCCHRFAPLSLGRLEGNDLRCGYHGMKFNSAGKCVEIPGVDRIPAQVKVRAFPVVERHSWIWVWMGDPAKADPDLIPPAIGLDDPKWTLACGQLDYQANYQLINDNLTDFSHLSYVHAASFGATEDWARARPVITELDRGVRGTRWIVDGYKKDMALSKTTALGSTGTVTWQVYDYLVPAVLLLYTSVYPKDQMPPDGISPPTSEPLSANFSSHAITPISDKVSRYRFSWGPLAGQGSAEQAQVMLKIAYQAFAEDRRIIEGQQLAINHRSGKEIVVAADSGPVKMRAVIAKLAEAEQTFPRPVSAVS